MQGQPVLHQQGCQEGVEAHSRAEARLREAYKAMLLQQQSRHRSDVARRQAKHQRQLDAQVGAALFLLLSTSILHCSPNSYGLVVCVTIV